MAVIEGRERRKEGSRARQAWHGFDEGCLSGFDLEWPFPLGYLCKDWEEMERSQNLVARSAHPGPFKFWSDLRPNPDALCDKVTLKRRGRTRQFATVVPGRIVELQIHLTRGLCEGLTL